MIHRDSYARTPISVYGKYQLWLFACVQEKDAFGIRREIHKCLLKRPLFGGWQTPGMFIIWDRKDRS